jgi:peptide chain release factor subunit 1
MEYELMQIINKAENIKGHGTELISVYVPANQQVYLTIARLQDELVQAERIQSKSTKTNIKEGLTKIINRIKEYREIKNGIILLYGNGTLLVYEPKIPINVNIYSCDSKFKLNPLYDMAKPQKKYCLLVMDGKEATIAMINGSDVTILKYMESLVPSKTNAGGQSAARYHRVIEQAIKEFYNRIASLINEEYKSRKFDSIIIGGSGFSKDSFIKEKLLNYQISIKGVLDTGYTDEAGIYELINNAKEIFKNDTIGMESELLTKFKALAVKNQALFGDSAINNLSKAKKIIISDKMIPIINIDNQTAEITVVSSEHQLGKEFLIYAKGIGICD